MPKYEIGYILSSGIADDQVPHKAAEVAKGIESVGGRIIKEDHWGRKKLAYPIGRTRNGYYVFVTADVEPDKVAQIEHKLLTTEGVIRFLLVNLTDADKRRARDQEVRAQFPRTASMQEKSDTPAQAGVETPGDLDQKIEEALSSQEEKV